MKLIGYILLGIGAMISLISFGTDTAPEGTHNIGLMQSQMMLFHTGGVLVILGGFFTVAAIVLSRLEAAGILPPAGVTAGSPNSGARE
jgi:hypothetical protein